MDVIDVDQSGEITLEEFTDFVLNADHEIAYKLLDVSVMHAFHEQDTCNGALKITMRNISWMCLPTLASTQWGN